MARHAQGTNEAENQGETDEGEQGHTRLVPWILFLLYGDMLGARLESEWWVLGGIASLEGVPRKC